MKNPGIKYLVALCAILGLFSQFVSCGAQLYKASLEDDTQDSRLKPGTTASNSEIKTALTSGIHARNGWQKIPINFRVDPSLTADQRKGLGNAMALWEKVVGKKLFNYVGVHDGVHGDSFKDLYSSLNDRVNGHYLDYNWGKTGKENFVLATTIWNYLLSDANTIETADIRFNSNFYLLGDAFKMKARDNLEVVDMTSLAIHELGHLLGLTHVSESEDPGSIMVPSLYIGEGLTNRRVSQNDIRHLQSIYGCEGSSCDVEKVYEDIVFSANNELDQAYNGETEVGGTTPDDHPLNLLESH